MKTQKHKFFNLTQLIDEDELFKSKYGKTFTKFIDNKVINNKFSDIPSKLNQKPKF